MHQDASVSTVHVWHQHLSLHCRGTCTTDPPSSSSSSLAQREGGSRILILMRTTTSEVPAREMKSTCRLNTSPVLQQAPRESTGTSPHEPSEVRGQMTLAWSSVSTQSQNPVESLGSALMAYLTCFIYFSEELTLSPSRRR